MTKRRLIGVLATGSLVVLCNSALSTRQASRGPVGEWALVVEWPARSADVTLAVTEEDNRLRATWKGPQGLLTPSEVTFSEGVLRFTIEVEGQNADKVRLRFQGRVTDDAMDGALQAAQGTRITVKGRRKPSMATD